MTKNATKKMTNDCVLNLPVVLAVNHAYRPLLVMKEQLTSHIFCSNIFRDEWGFECPILPLRFYVRFATAFDDRENGEGIEDRVSLKCRIGSFLQVRIKYIQQNFLSLKMRLMDYFGAFWRNFKFDFGLLFLFGNIWLADKCVDCYSLFWSDIYGWNGSVFKEIFVHCANHDGDSGLVKGELKELQRLVLRSF